MTYQSFFGKASKCLCLPLLTSALSFSAVIYDSGIAALKATDPIQIGRLSRSGVPSDWSASKAFPGVLNSTTAYRYESSAIPVSPFPYLQITFDDISGTGYDFASAYLNSYVPSSTAANRGLDVNYLGDAGSSGNYFGTDPATFQIVMPSTASQLLVVVNDATGTTSGIGANFRVLVEGFYDTNFNDTTPTPEPATMALSGTGFAVAAIAAYRRKRKQNELA